MKKSLVKFANVKFDKLDKEATLPAKFQRMLKSLPLDEMVEGKTVALKMCYKTTDETLSLFPNTLQSINLTGCTKVTNRGIDLLAQSCNSNLRELYLNGCKRITDATLQSLADRCPNLKRIELNGCNQITAAGINSLQEKCRHIESLQAFGCPRVSVNKQLPFKQTYPALSIDLTRCSNASSNNAIKNLAKHHTSLQTLDLTGSKIELSGLQTLANHCSHLHSLNLSFCNQITDQMLVILAGQFQAIQVITLTCCDEISAKGMDALQLAHPGLQIIAKNGQPYKWRDRLQQA